tara:strand:+ start:1296 stop:1562 length:267 start_codon:yes stop_codon:yes gene_type:complete
MSYKTILRTGTRKLGEYTTVEKHDQQELRLVLGELQTSGFENGSPVAGFEFKASMLEGRTRDFDDLHWGPTRRSNVTGNVWKIETATA